MSSPFQGELSTFGFADLLQWMELNRRSGRLTLTRGKDRRIIDWKDGEIVYVSGSHPRDRLAVFLKRTRALPPATLQALLARNFTSGTNLTRLILDGRHDTITGLSRRVEELARRLLFEIFEWRDGSFEYDPYSPVERILRIRLRLRPQVLSFQAVKHIDDAHRRRRRRPTGSIDLREALLHTDELERRFWNVAERTGSSLDVEEGRRRSEQMREFAERLGKRLQRIQALRPIHEDSAVLLRELLKRESPELSEVATVASLDPALTLDLLVLANSLIADRRGSAATAGEALARLEGDPVVALAQRLADSDFPRIPQEDRAGVAVRRASIAAAVAAARRAEEFEIPADRAYALGLLHTVPYADLLAVVEEMGLAPGRFRAALIEAHRPLVGRVRAELWSLPLDLEAVMTDEGADPRPPAALVRAARAALPDCALGLLPDADVSAREARAAAVEVNRLFEFLSLPPAGARGSVPRR